MEEQAGIVTRAQMLAAGMSAGQVRARLRSGRWQRIFPGVYATFSGPVPRLGRMWAAVLAAGADAMLSHQSAAELLQLADADDGPIHVTLPHERQQRRLAGVIIHRSHHAARDRHPTRQPPQARVEATVIALSQSAGGPREAAAWVVRACGRRLTTVERLKRWIADRDRLRHRKAIEAALADVEQGCQSGLERRYLRSVERPHGLPRAERQARRRRPGGSWYDDVSYDGYRTIVELDGDSAHPAETRSLDRRRDNAAVATGHSVLRFGYLDVTYDPCGCAAQVAKTLVQNGWAGSIHPCGPGCMIGSS